jgi:hypothetical protein
MNCPRCGSEQEAAAQECAGCGVVFAKLQEAQDRAQLRLTQSSRQALPDLADDSPGIPRGLVIGLLIVVIFFGAIWTIRRREARASRDLGAEGKAMLNEINARQNEVQRQLNQERDRLARMDMQQRAIDQPAPSRPDGLDETQAKHLLEQCIWFQSSEILKLPKSYQEGSRLVHQDFPALHAATVSGVVTIANAGGSTTVSLAPDARARMRITETADGFEIYLGRRRVAEIESLTGSGGRAQAVFQHTYDERVAAETLLPSEVASTGRVSFILKSGVWQVEQAYLTQGSAARDLCR